jgi:hypothetical protein
MLKCLFATSYMDFISIVIEAKCSGCDKKMPYKNGRMPFGHQCGMLTFGMKTFLLNFRTKNCLKPVRREAGLGSVTSCEYIMSQPIK